MQHQYMCRLSDSTASEDAGNEPRGRILGRKWDKNHNSFPPCYSQFHGHLYKGFYPPAPPPPSKSGMKLVCNVNIYTV